MTVKEQMLYEVHDPANYITPDVVVDFTTAELEQVGPDRVRVTDISGKPRTPTLKVSIGCTEGFIGEDMFFYAGPGRAAARAAGQAHPGGALQDRRSASRRDPHRFPGRRTPSTARCRRRTRRSPTRSRCASPRAPRTREEAIKVGREVDGMAVSGVGMTGKRVPHQDRTREIIGVWSSLVPREKIVPAIKFFES